jgi:hypothetical protein
MKRWMEVAVLGMGALLLAAPSASASPLCISSGVAVTLAVQQTNATVCTVGNFEFNFTSLPTATGAPTTPGAQAQLPSFTTIRIDDLSPTSTKVTWAAADATTSWSTSAAAQFTYFYTVTPLVPLALTAMQLDVYNAFAPGGVVTSSKSAQGGASQTASTGVFLLSTPGPQHLSDSTSFSPIAGTVSFQDGLTLVGATSKVGGAGTVGSMVNTLNYQSSVPEPFTMALSGAGLIGLGLLRSRAKKA